MEYKSMRYALLDSRQLMNRDIKNAVSSYIDKGLARNFILEYNGNLFDIKTLNTMANLDCLNCHKVHDVMCCDGTGYPPFREDVNLVFANFKRILKSQCSQDLYKDKIKHIEKYGLLAYDFDYHRWYDTIEEYKHATFRMHDGKCIFSVPVNKDNPDGAYRCAIHAYALQNGIDVFDFKPRACQLYPVDIIQIDNKYDFVFGVSKDADDFSRWHSGGYCVPYEEAEQVFNETGAFDPKKYKPIYMEEQHLLERLYGNKVIDFIKKHSARFK